MRIARGSRYYSGVVGGNIDAVWDLFMDWGDISWIDNVDAEGPVLAKSTLEGEVDAIPRTRVMKRANAVESGLPLENREVLMLADKVAYRLYYDANDGCVHGIRNYIASWALDPISENSCQMTIQSTFDVDESGTLEGVTSWLDNVYVMIVRSLDKHFAKQLAAAN